MIAQNAQFLVIFVEFIGLFLKLFYLSLSLLAPLFLLFCPGFGFVIKTAVKFFRDILQIFRGETLTVFLFGVFLRNGLVYLLEKNFYFFDKFCPELFC